jgi:protein tyrosine phosphatase (PTP) superfamily phosphohydrolase (DUF442 family)
LELLTANPETVYNWGRLDDRITTSGQPTEQQLADIQAPGIRHIINLALHTHEKALPDEAERRQHCPESRPSANSIDHLFNAISGPRP